MNIDNLKFLDSLAEDLEAKGNFVEANIIHQYFVKQSDKFK